MARETVLQATAEQSRPLQMRNERRFRIHIDDLSWDRSVEIKSNAGPIVGDVSVSDKPR